MVNKSILIWTTTPWTLPGNRALAFANDIDYILMCIKSVDDNSIAQINDKIVVAKELQQLVMKETGITAVEILSTFPGKELENTECDHPLKEMGYDFVIKALEADFVTLEQGTGIVHVAPGHGADDYNLGIKNNIEIVQTVTDDGTYNLSLIHI